MTDEEVVSFAKSAGKIGLEIVRAGGKVYLIFTQIKDSINNLNSKLQSSEYMKQLNDMSQNKINHIINGSKNSIHGWEKLVPDKNWNDIKNIIVNVMDNGVEGPYKSVFSKKAIINGIEVEVTYTKLSDGTIKISDAWVCN